MFEKWNSGPIKCKKNERMIKMKFQMKPIVVEAVQYKRDMGFEDGFAVYETEYPEDGHTFEVAENIDTTRMTIIQAAVRTPVWRVVSEGDWIVSFPGGEKEIWKDGAFQERFINTQKKWPLFDRKLARR